MSSTAEEGMLNVYQNLSLWVNGVCCLHCSYLLVYNQYWIHDPAYTFPSLKVSCHWVFVQTHQKENEALID